MDNENNDSMEKIIQENIAEARKEFDIINYTRDLFYRGNPTRDVDRKIDQLKSRLFIKIITGEDINRE